MTFHSGRIEVLVGGAGSDLEPTRSDLPLLVKLPEHCNWVHALGVWANTNSKQVHYIDNCWFRVAVTASELSAFLKGQRWAQEPWVPQVMDRVRADDAYIIEAESF